jgi:3-phytase
MTFVRSHAAIVVAISPIALAGCSADLATDRVVHPVAVSATAAVPVNQVQDCAFWVHPTLPEKSLLLVTNERRGLEVHNLDGVLLKHLDEGICPQYVDVLYGFKTTDGSAVDLALATCTADHCTGVKVWSVDPAKSKLTEVTAGKAETQLGAAIPVLDGEPPLGIFTYKSPRDGRSYFFVTSESGTIEQHEIVAEAGGKISARRLRQFPLNEKAKSGVADEARGVVYVAEEKSGIWRYPAEPDGTSTDHGTLVIPANEHGLLPHVRGPALFRGESGAGYLLVLSQGSKGGHSIVNVYDRNDYHYVLTIDPSSAGPGPIDHASGLDVTSCQTTARLARGALAINDQTTPSGNEEFKVYAWADIAAKGSLRLKGHDSP